MRLINIRKKYFSNAFHNEMLKGTLSMILEFFLSRKLGFPLFRFIYLFCPNTENTLIYTRTIEEATSYLQLQRWWFWFPWSLWMLIVPFNHLAHTSKQKAWHIHLINKMNRTYMKVNLQVISGSTHH